MVVTSTGHFRSLVRAPAEPDPIGCWMSTQSGCTLVDAPTGGACVFRRSLCRNQGSGMTHAFRTAWVRRPGGQSWCRWSFFNPQIDVTLSRGNSLLFGVVPPLVDRGGCPARCAHHSLVAAASAADPDGSVGGCVPARGLGALVAALVGSASAGLLVSVGHEAFEVLSRCPRHRARKMS